jgi:hypothetical protein
MPGYSMNAPAKSRLRQAVQLPAVERAGLVDELFESPHKTDAAIDVLWLREAERRIAYRAVDLD